MVVLINFIALPMLFVARVWAAVISLVVRFQPGEGR